MLRLYAVIQAPLQGLRCGLLLVYQLLMWHVQLNIWSINLNNRHWMIEAIIDRKQPVEGRLYRFAQAH